MSITKRRERSVNKCQWALKSHDRKEGEEEESVAGALWQETEVHVRLSAPPSTYSPTEGGKHTEKPDSHQRLANEEQV